MYSVGMEDFERVSANECLRAAATATELKRVLREVFVSEGDVTEWWASPHPMLDGAAPRDVSMTPEGIEKVRRLLVGLQYGFPV